MIREIEERTWRSLCHEGTSPIPRAAEATDEILAPGIGNVARVLFPLHIWEETVPKSCDQAMKVQREGATCMMEAIRKVNDLIFVERLPAGWAFVIPKSALKASFIFHPVWLNEKTRQTPPPPPSICLF